MPQAPANFTTMASVSVLNECDIPTMYEHIAPRRDNVCLSTNTYQNGNDLSSAIKRSYRLVNSDRPFPSHSSNPLEFAQSSQSYLLSLSPPTSTFTCSDRQSIRTSTVCILESLKHSGPNSDRASPAYDCRSSPFQESGSFFIEQDSRPCCDSGLPYERKESPYLHNNDIESPYTAVCSTKSASDHYQRNDSPYAVSQCSYINERYFCVQNDDDKPIDLSRKSESDPNLNFSQDYNSVEIQDSGSLLRNLLRHGTSGNQQIVPEDCRNSTSLEKHKPVSETTQVTLAKKMLHPIASRISDWLVKIVQFAKSVPEFCLLSQNDKMTLIINSWTRLLLLLMAENEFEFAITPLSQNEQMLYNTDPSQNEPTMKSVEGIQQFIKKCKHMCIDQTEYALIRMVVLFNSGYAGLDSRDIVEKLSTAAQQLLQQHVTSLHPAQSIHYSRILMLLPFLYGINCIMVENLFCKHINTDIDVLLKELLQKL